MEFEHKVNEQIKANKVFLISLEGEQNGIVSLSEALEKAKGESLDLIEVDDKNGMPVCRIADYGKMKYRFNKKNKENQTKQVLKEMKFNYNIGEHDLVVKHNKIRNFLEKHFKVLYIMELKGRERGLVESAIDKISKNLANFEDLAVWKEPSTGYDKGKISISTTLSPK